MKAAFFFLGCAWVVCFQGISADTPSAEPVLLERNWVNLFSGNKSGKSPSERGSKNSNDDEKSNKPVFIGRKKNVSGRSKKHNSSRLRKKEKHEKRNKGKRGLRGFGRRKQKKKNRQENSRASPLYTRGRGRRNDVPEKRHRRRYQEETESLHKEIEADQNESAFIEGGITDRLQSTAKDIKKHLTKAILHDIDNVLNQVEESH